MNETELDAIRERVRKATPGPWHIIREGIYWLFRYPPGPEAEFEAHRLGIEQVVLNAQFAAAAREDVPALLAEVDRLRRLAITALARSGHGPGCHPSEGRHSEECLERRTVLAGLRHETGIEHPTEMCPSCTPPP